MAFWAVPFFSNLHLVRDALDFIDKTNDPAILLTLDQEKAFDHVDHEFMLHVLRKFGFGPSFCHWVEIFHAHAFSHVLVNGVLSCPVYLHRGVRQGCPLSPLLYLLVSEVLSTQIWNCKDIEGFLLPGAGGLQFKISQYVDDATSILKSESSLCNMLRVVHKFELGSGAKLNTSKSEAMWLGRWRGCGDSPFGLKWVTKIRILGVFFSNGLVSVHDDNWNVKLNKLSSILGLWKQRDLSFIGRSMIVNVLGASRLWHVAKVIVPPSWVYDKFKSIVWLFIWNGKMENVSHDRCCAPVRAGGLNVINFDVKCSSLHLSNFLSLRDDFGACKWHYLARYFLGNRLAVLDRRFSFSSNLCPSSNVPSSYYAKCLVSFRFLFSTYKSLPDDLSCKSLYLLFLDVPPVAPKSAGFWGSVVGRPINRWSWVWRKSRLKLVENRKNDLIWLLIHRAIGVCYALKTCGYIDNNRCAVCNRIETIEHCFLECPRVVKLWDYFSPLLSLLLGSQFFFTPTTVYYPFSCAQSSTGVIFVNYLMATILYWVWLARNRATFRNSVLDSKKIIDLVKNGVRVRISSDCLDSARNFWSYRNVLCSVSSDDQVSPFPPL